MNKRREPNFDDFIRHWRRDRLRSGLVGEDLERAIHFREQELKELALRNGFRSDLAEAARPYRSVAEYVRALFDTHEHNNPSAIPRPKDEWTGGRRWDAANRPPTVEAWNRAAAPGFRRLCRKSVIQNMNSLVTVEIAPRQGQPVFVATSSDIIGLYVRGNSLAEVEERIPAALTTALVALGRPGAIVEAVNDQSGETRAFVPTSYLLRFRITT